MKWIKVNQYLNFANLVQHNSNLSSSLLWHARFGHINYDSFRILKQKGSQGLRQAQ